MTVLLTGGGSIGLASAARLSSCGDRVILVDIVEPRSVPDGVEFVRGDVTDHRFVFSTVERFGITEVIHSAALLSDAIRRDPLHGYRVNVMGTAVVLEAARRFELGRVVLASSTTVEYSVFGDFAGEAIPENFTMRVLDQAPLSIYAATKLANENLALLYCRGYGADVVVLRYAAVVNPAVTALTSVPGRLLDKLVRAGRADLTAAVDDPLLWWGGIEEFVDARDCVDANVAALTCRDPRQRVYSIAGRPLSFESFVNEVRTVFPRLRVNVSVAHSGGFAGFPQPRSAPTSIVAARQELGFIPRYTVAETARAYAERLENHDD